MLVSILLDFLCMLEHTHSIKMRVGLIRRDKEGLALSESAAGVLEGEEEENGKKPNTKIQWRRRMVVLGWPQFPQPLLGRGVVRMRDETSKQQGTHESPQGVPFTLWASTCSTIQGRRSSHVPLAWAACWELPGSDVCILRVSLGGAR